MRFTNVRFEDSTYYFSDCVFENCDLANATLRDASLLRCSFVTRHLTGINRKDVNFIACELTGANFSKTPLAGVDLHQSQFEQLTLEIDNLRGCTVNEQQAQQFLQLLQLHIKN